MRLDPLSVWLRRDVHRLRPLRHAPGGRSAMPGPWRSTRRQHGGRATSTTSRAWARYWRTSGSGSCGCSGPSPRRAGSRNLSCRRTSAAGWHRAGGCSWRSWRRWTAGRWSAPNHSNRSACCHDRSARTLTWCCWSSATAGTGSSRRPRRTCSAPASGSSSSTSVSRAIPNGWTRSRPRSPTGTALW